MYNGMIRGVVREGNVTIVYRLGILGSVSHRRRVYLCPPECMLAGDDLVIAAVGCPVGEINPADPIFYVSCLVRDYCQHATSLCNGRGGLMPLLTPEEVGL